jgi:hypothetical protein
VIFTLQHNPSLFDEIEKGKDSIEDVNYAKVMILKFQATIMKSLLQLGSRCSLARARD